MVSLRSLMRIARLVVSRPGRSLATVYGVLAGPQGECPCCGHQGEFLPCDLQPAWQCPECLGLHRHRLLALAMRGDFLGFTGRDVVHFAPEPAICRVVRLQQPASYITADLAPGLAEFVLDIEAIDLPNASVDMVIASHVLEHVDDRKALAELWRILRPGGQLVAMVPIVEGWAETYEDPGVSTGEYQAIHFGHAGHLRLYGRDFRDRLVAAGFSITEFTASGADSARYRLKRGCKVFLATKDAVRQGRSGPDRNRE